MPRVLKFDQILGLIWAPWTLATLSSNLKAISEHYSLYSIVGLNHVQEMITLLVLRLNKETFPLLSWRLKSMFIFFLCFELNSFVFSQWTRIAFPGDGISSTGMFIFCLLILCRSFWDLNVKQLACISS